MPNWCECAVIVGGEGAEEFLAAVETKETLFEALLPRPTEFDGVFTGGATMADGTRASAWRELKSADDTGRAKLVAVTPEEEAEWVSKYGASNWWDWSIANWGTKWDPSYERDNFTLRFESAWGPPVEFFRTVSSRFPRATFLLAYAEGGMGFWGEALIRDGDVRDDYRGFPAEAFWSDFDEDDDDALPAPTPAVAAHLEKYGLGTGG